MLKKMLKRKKPPKGLGKGGGDERLGKPVSRRKALLGVAALGAGAPTAMHSTKVKADPAVTAKISALQATMEFLADEALNQAKELGREAVKGWTSMFSLTTSEIENQNNLTISSLGAVADSEAKRETDFENRRITIGNQPPPSACTNDTVLRILFNRYPQVSKLRKESVHLNLNRVLRDTANAVADDLLGVGVVENRKLTTSEKATNTRETLKSYRTKFADDEHLNAGLFLKNGAYSSEELEQVEVQSDVVFMGFRGKWESATPEDLETEVGVRREVKRQSQKAILSACYEASRDSVLKRSGDEDSYSDIEKSIASLVSSEDDRDALYGNGLRHLLDSYVVENGGQHLSIHDLERYKVDSRSIPEYDEYINNMGDQPAPYLKELILMRRDSMRMQFDQLQSAERLNNLLAHQLRAAVEKAESGFKRHYEV